MDRFRMFPISKTCWKSSNPTTRNWTLRTHEYSLLAGNTETEKEQFFQHFVEKKNSYLQQL